MSIFTLYWSRWSISKLDEDFSRIWFRAYFNGWRTKSTEITRLKKLNGWIRFILDFINIRKEKTIETNVILSWKCRRSWNRPSFSKLTQEKFTHINTCCWICRLWTVWGEEIFRWSSHRLSYSLWLSNKWNESSTRGCHSFW